MNELAKEEGLQCHQTWEVFEGKKQALVEMFLGSGEESDVVSRLVPLLQ